MWQGRRYPGRVTPPRKRLAIALALAAAGLCAAAGAGTAGAPPASAGPAKAGSAHPNVLVIETDDQTAASMSVMSNVNSRIVARGATFQNSFVNYSLCCPSRSTFLTGQYEHNHGVLGNSSPDGGFGRFESLHGTNNLAVWLQHSGYYTGLIGKYLNGYSNSPPVPPGWSEWHAAAPATLSVYDYTLNENGTLVQYGTDPQDFKQDVLTGKAVEFVDRRAPARKPFFLWLTYTAPHAGGPNPNPQPPANCDGTAKPAPRHAHSFDSEPLPMPPNYNEADVSDKPAEISSRPPLTAADTATITRHYRCRLESLLSVDEGVNSIMDALKATGELSNTYVVFTSDNGFFHGEHRIPGGKLHIYEESIRVPLAIRGPGIPHGGKVRDLAINADLAPTIVDVTGARPRLTMDGRSLVPLARHPTVERGRELLIEQPTFEAIRTQRYIYAEHNTGEKELYDLKNDPFELQSRHDDPAYAAVKARLAARLHSLEECQGASCRTQPALRLALRHRSAHRHGHRCALRPIRALVKGRNAGGVVKAEFYVHGKLVGVDTRAPFRHRLPFRKFDRHGKTTVRVRASMLDGRRMTIDRRIRACR
ncbi:MAG TPA: sulfatase [Solirubrobacterales bacterium]|nr:sulfatase [Solirubrobacterales bacterium]